MLIKQSLVGNVVPYLDKRGRVLMAYTNRDRYAAINYICMLTEYSSAKSLSWSEWLVHLRHE